MDNKIMDNKIKVVQFPIPLESIPDIVTQAEFHQAFYAFLRRIKIVKDPSDYLQYLFVNQKEIRYLIEKYNIE